MNLLSPGKGGNSAWYKMIGTIKKKSMYEKSPGAKGERLSGLVMAVSSCKRGLAQKGAMMAWSSAKEGLGQNEGKLDVWLSQSGSRIATSFHDNRPSRLNTRPTGAGFWRVR